MKIYFENARFSNKTNIKRVFNTAIEETGNNVKDIAVCVKFVSEKEIARLNRDIRSIDKITDVLSFPMLEIVAPKKLSEFECERDMNGELFIGDIAICKKVASRQAKEFGHSFKREETFLALHGLLHLLGYDHLNEEDEKIMMSTAEKILDTHKIKRGENGI